MANPLINKFMNSKTIQKSYNFDLFINEPESESLTIKDMERLTICVKNIQLPQTKFSLESVQLGQFMKIFGVLESQTYYNLKIVFEEDKYKTVQKFITYCQNKIMNKNTGYYKPINSAFLNRINVNVYTDKNVGDISKGSSYIFWNCILVDVTEPNYDYSVSQAIEYSLNFACQYMDYNYKDTKKEESDNTPINN